MTREFALLTAQFALMKGLLIGVAGFHRETFSAEHVVHTVQAAAKHFEHHPEFLNEAHDLLVESQMDGARGLAILLRHASGSRRFSRAQIHICGYRDSSIYGPSLAEALSACLEYVSRVNLDRALFHQSHWWFCRVRTCRPAPRAGSDAADWRVPPK